MFPATGVHHVMDLLKEVDVAGCHFQHLGGRGFATQSLGQLVVDALVVTPDMSDRSGYFKFVGRKTMRKRH